jgi:hypothetical protein
MGCFRNCLTRDWLPCAQILPFSCADLLVQAHLFADYWEDIGKFLCFSLAFSLSLWYRKL